LNRITITVGSIIIEAKPLTIRALRTDGLWDKIIRMGVPDRALLDQMDDILRVVSTISAVSSDTPYTLEELQDVVILPEIKNVDSGLLQLFRVSGLVPEADASDTKSGEFVTANPSEAQ
jgi:hypothetical protein